MKTILVTLFLILTFVFFRPEPAQAGMQVWKVVDVAPGIMVPMMTQSEFRICQIRRFFCGKTGAVIVAFAVFCAGMLVITEKLHWSAAILLIGGILTFYNARYFGQFFGRQTVGMILFIDNPMCDCRCSINIDMMVTQSAADTMDQLKNCVTSLGYDPDYHFNGQ